MNKDLWNALVENEELREVMATQTHALALTLANSIRLMQKCVKETRDQDVSNAVLTKMIADEWYRELTVLTMDNLDANWREEAMKEIMNTLLATEEVNEVLNKNFIDNLSHL